MKKYCSVKALRMKYELTRYKFSEILNIPYDVIEKWETGEEECPYYVYSMMQQILAFHTMLIDCILDMCGSVVDDE